MPPDAWLIAATDGFFDSFAGSRELMAWLDYASPYLADPAREGRGVGTAGLDSAGAYLAKEMRRLGLSTGGDSASYLQRFEVTTGAAAM